MKSITKERVVERLNYHKCSSLFSEVDKDTINITMSCGHSKNIVTMSFLKSKTLRCQQCKQDEISLLANNHNITLLDGPDVSGNYHFLKSDCECGNCTFKILPTKLFNQKPGKSDCSILREVADKLENTPFKCVGKVLPQHVEILCQNGHQFSVQTSNVKNSTIRCKSCYIDKLKQEATHSGITFLEENSNKAKRHNLYRLACGCLQEMRSEDVRNKQFFCHTCQGTSYAKPSYVYFVEITCEGVSWLKVGYSSYPERRFNQLFELNKDVSFKLHHLLYLDTRWLAVKIEKEIHSKLIENRIPSELLSRVMIGGHTECYHKESFNEIMELLKTYEPLKRVTRKILDDSFNKLSEGAKDRTLLNLGSATGKNSTERKKLFDKVIKTKKFTFREILEAMKNTEL